MRTWLCSWALDCTAHAPHAAQPAPEIDGATILGAVAILVIVTLIWREG